MTHSIMMFAFGFIAGVGAFILVSALVLGSRREHPGRLDHLPPLPRIKRKL